MAGLLDDPGLAAQLYQASGIPGLLSDTGRFFGALPTAFAKTGQAVGNAFTGTARQGLRNEADFLSGIDPNTGQPATTPYQRANVLAHFFMSNMGPQSAAGIAIGAPEMAIGAGPIRAFHGSPFDFDRFDLSKIGTGEGAQAYGHGLYFAGNPQVAASYKMTQPTGGSIAMPQDVRSALDHLDRLGYDTRQQALNAIRTAHNWRSVYDVSLPGDKEAASVIDRFVQANPRGRMYEVNINASPGQLLDWDKPLAQQPSILDRLRAGNVFDDLAQGKIYGMPISNATGENVYRGAAYATGTAPGASQALSNAGIPGIQYLDQGSRAAGEGTRNYVIFNPGIVSILRKYGIGGLLAGGAAGSLLSSQGQQ